MSLEQAVEVKCRGCEKRGRVGVSFQYLTDGKPGCNRGLRERMALRCPALMRTFSEARSKLTR
jgi:hypothetical protein